MRMHNRTVHGRKCLLPVCPPKSLGEQRKQLKCSPPSLVARLDFCVYGLSRRTAVAAKIEDMPPVREESTSVASFAGLTSSVDRPAIDTYVHSIYAYVHAPCRSIVHAHARIARRFFTRFTNRFFTRFTNRSANRFFTRFTNRSANRFTNRFFTRFTNRSANRFFTRFTNRFANLFLQSIKRFLGSIKRFLGSIKRFLGSINR